MKKSTCPTIKRFLPITIILLAMAAVYLSGITDYISFEQLKAHRMAIKSFVEAHSLSAPLIFIAVYIASTALSVPGGAYLSLFGGFIFPQPWSSLYVILGATMGATIIFLAARTAIGDFLHQKAGPFLKKMEAGFKENAWSYLLFLRLVPIFPFWLINLAPAFFGVPLFTYVWTTFVGIIPGVFVYTQTGAGLGAIFDTHESFSLGALFNRDIKIALAAIACFALIPVIARKLRGQGRSKKLEG